ncbi:hypothetical protein BZA77DRAFT_355910 [Pyronema omphalodes]|nr:hypothetical protein BZA77DRAFT_355910 [Pyronema omphalodes]
MNALQNLPSTNPTSFSSTKPAPVRILKISQSLGMKNSKSSPVTVTTERADDTKPLVYVVGRDAGVRQRLRIDSSSVKLGFVEMARGEGERRRRGADGWGTGKKEEGMEKEGMDKEKDGEKERKGKEKQLREEEKEEQRPRKRPRKMMERRV